MLEPEPPLETHRLPALLMALHRARSTFEDERGVRPPTPALLSARVELLHALEQYIAGLEAARRPVPYRLRDELRLRRALRASPYGN